MGKRLIDQVAVVTGGSRGIGLAISRALARERARVVIAALNEARGQAAARDIQEAGGRAEFIQTDVTERDQVKRLVALTLERHGDINVLVNNAGVSGRDAFWEETEELWDRMDRVNVMGTVLPLSASYGIWRTAGEAPSSTSRRRRG